MARKRKTLPKDFEEMLTTASIDELIAVFDKCELDAHGGYGKSTAIGLRDCPDELIVWLVEQGLDVNSRNQYGQTPIAARAISQKFEHAQQIPLLLSLGGDIEAPDLLRRTPFQLAVLELRADNANLLVEHGAALSGANWNLGTLLEKALAGVANVSIPDAVETVRLLLRLGAPITDGARANVTRIGETFERYRDAFNEDSLPAVQRALHELYEIFEVQPVAQTEKHDGKSPIVAEPGTWQKQHAALWDYLVPGSGATATMQGEIIRITGKIADETYRNGGLNWGPDHRAMVDALVEFLGSHVALDEEDLAEVRILAPNVRKGEGAYEELDRLSEFAVKWVARNPDPYPFG